MAIKDYSGLSSLPIFDFLPDAYSFQINYAPVSLISKLTKTADFLKPLFLTDVKTFKANYTLINRQNIKEFYQFINSVKINYKRFWLPVFVNVLELSRNVAPSDTHIFVKYSYQLLHPTEIVPKFRLFFFKPLANDNYLLIVRKVVNVEKISDSEERITLNTTVGHNLALNDFLIIGRVALVRFANNTIRLNYSFSRVKEVQDQILATTSLEFIELPYELYKEIP